MTGELRLERLGTAVRIGNYPVGSVAWHRARRAGLGGSEVAAVLGLSKWESPFSLWHRKAGESFDNLDSPEMEAGRRLEPVIRQKWVDDHPGWRMRARAGTWRHKERPWQIANPDGIAIGPGGKRVLFEAKFALYDDEWGPAGSDDIAVYYRCQTQWYLDVFGLDECHLTVFIGGCAEFRSYVIPADRDDQATLRAAAVPFLESVAAGVRPNIDGHDATYQTIKALHPDIAPMSVQLPSRLAASFIEAKAVEKAAEINAKRWAGEVLDFMGNAQHADFGKRRIASRQARGNGLPYLVAARNLPENLDALEAKAS